MTQRDHKFGGAHTEEAVPGSIHSLWSRKEKKLPKNGTEEHFLRKPEIARVCLGAQLLQQGFRGYISLGLKGKSRQI